MTDSWHKTETDLDADKYAVDFWSRHRVELQSGEFWADHIRKLKGEPEKRLALAIENLPLPASFREAAIATRALIRLKEPGYNVVESVPGKKLKGLPFSYKSLGYTKLELLNKTDIKWLSELWGEPEEHTTLHEMHNDVWREYEGKLKAKRSKRDEEFIISINELAPSPRQFSNSLNKSKSIGKGKWLIVVVIIGLILVTAYGG